MAIDNAWIRNNLARALGTLAKQAAVGEICEEAKWLLDTRLIWLAKGQATQLEDEDLRWPAEAPEDLRELGYAAEGNLEDSAGQREAQYLRLIKQISGAGPMRTRERK